VNNLSRRGKIFIISTTVILVTLLLFVLSKDLIVSADRAVFPTKASDISDSYAGMISIQEINVANSPNEDARKIEEVRLQTLGREATFVAEGQAAQPDPVTPLPTQFINATLQVIDQRDQVWGMIENPSVPMSGSAFLAENAWRLDMGDGYVLVIAGYSPKYPEEGLLFVTIDRKNMFTTRTFIAPGNGGSIRIEKAVGMRIVLTAKNKDTLYFDIPGLRFVNSLEEVVPTATELIPAATPVNTATPLPLPPYPNP
jgi:hypothetical protein